MAKQKWLRKRECGTIFGYNAVLATNPKMEVVELDLSKPQEAKPEDKPKPSTKKAPSKKKAASAKKKAAPQKAAPKKKAASRKPPSKPVVADSEEELDAILEGIDSGAENS